MNQIQEMDWAEDCWHGHTGMDSSNDYCIIDEEKKKEAKEKSQLENEDPEGDRELKTS